MPGSKSTQSTSSTPYYRDVQMDTAKGLHTYSDIRMNTAKAPDDIYMETARPGTTVKQNVIFKPREKELLDSAEVKRKATVAQLCLSPFCISGFRPDDHQSDFLDYYFQLLGYISARKDRRTRFDDDTAARALKGNEYIKEFKSYCGRERVVLRKRRTKLKVDQFHIIAQVGQGGYGEVFLARKQESGEVCALKKMRKRTLFKMDEVPSLHTSFHKPG